MERTQFGKWRAESAHMLEVVREGTARAPRQAHSRGMWWSCSRVKGNPNEGVRHFPLDELPLHLSELLHDFEEQVPLCRAYKSPKSCCVERKLSLFPPKLREKRQVIGLITSKLQSVFVSAPLVFFLWSSQVLPNSLSIPRSLMQCRQNPWKAPIAADLAPLTVELNLIRQSEQVHDEFISAGYACRRTHTPESDTDVRAPANGHTPRLLSDLRCFQSRLPLSPRQLLRTASGFSFSIGDIVSAKSRES